MTIDYAAQLLIHLLRRRFQLRIADHCHQRPNGSYKVYFHDLPDQGEAVTVVTRMRNIAKCWGKFLIKCAIVLTLLLSMLGQAEKFSSISMAQQMQDSNSELGIRARRGGEWGAQRENG